MWFGFFFCLFCFPWDDVCCQSLSSGSSWLIKSVLPSEHWAALSVLADTVVWVSESGYDWRITLLMILARDAAFFFKKADIRRVRLGFIDVLDWFELSARLFFNGPKSTLDYLMFLFYKLGLICKAKKQGPGLSGTHFKKRAPGFISRKKRKKPLQTEWRDARS